MELIEIQCFDLTTQCVYDILLQVNNNANGKSFSLTCYPISSDSMYGIQDLNKAQKNEPVPLLPAKIKTVFCENVINSKRNASQELEFISAYLAFRIGLDCLSKYTTRMTFRASTTSAICFLENI